MNTSLFLRRRTHFGTPSDWPDPDPLPPIPMAVKLAPESRRTSAPTRSPG
jgi:hypothetical protein